MGEKRVKDPVRVAAGKKSKRKGGNFERDCVNLLKKLGYDARRTVQFNGKSEHSLSDIIIESKPKLHIECKSIAKLPYFNRATTVFIKWIQQCERDTKVSGKDWVIFFKANNTDIYALFSHETGALNVDFHCKITINRKVYFIVLFEDYWN